MANTRMTAPNTFTKGLIMDFNPTITNSNCLVNALNATLLTFNGNEMQLQQDMGNGRVETTFLPEGYVPVGACEFGDIIYIVSYNPLENKSQIGCFPSPERNITSDEIADLNQNLSAKDFQEFSGDTPSGVIKSMSVKKVVYGNKNMNPGDKFIIYEEAATNESVLHENRDTLSDYGNSVHTHNEWPKLLKLKVVSIEDSGKIVDLNASVKWYDNDYYLAHLQKNNVTSKPDIDSYRSIVSSAYSVFQSKVSGKLAILAELETISGFSCTYDVYTSYNDNTQETNYKIYFYTSWETQHNDINPVGFIFTESEWSKDIDGGVILMPKYNNGIIEYVPSNKKVEVPVKSAATVLNGKIISYDCTLVKEYTRTYELENPSDTFDTYINTDSYNAKISNILDWRKVLTTYTAIKNQDDYTNLRPVTRVTRLLDKKTGEPVYENNKYRYLYNLDSYTTENNITKYNTKGLDGKNIEIADIEINDDIINNYFHKDIPSLITEDFKLKRKKDLHIVKDNLEVEEMSLDTDLSRMIWNYKVAPVLPYGVLNHLEVSGNIDFSKLGTGIINLNSWRYYNSGNVCTLTWGLDAYTEPNKGIAEVVFDFFDNQGCAASYHITDKSSFAGTFTEQIILTQRNFNYKLNSVDAYGNTYNHAGELDPNGTLYLDDNNKPTASETNHGPYKNDAGTLYPNILYLVKITVKYCPKDIVGNFNTDNTSGYKTFYRWLWTNNLFNEMYYNTADFDNLQPQLGLDFSATFDTKGSKGTNTLKPKYYTYLNNNEFAYDKDKDMLYKTLGANIYAINQDYKDDAVGNIRMTLNPTLSEGFNTFNLNKDALSLIKDLKVKLGKSTITKSIDTPSIIHTDENFTSPLHDTVQPVIAKSLDSHEDTSTGFDRSGYAGYNYGTNSSIISNDALALMQERITPIRNENTNYYFTDRPLNTVGHKDINMYSSQSAYESYLDSFSLNLLNAKLQADEPLVYYDLKGEKQEVNHYQCLTTTLANASASGEGIKLVLAGTAYSKMYASEMVKDLKSKVLKSLIHDTDSLKSVGFHYNNGHLYFNNLITWHMGESYGKDTRYGVGWSKGIDDTNWKKQNNMGITNDNNAGNGWKPVFTDKTVQELLQNNWTGPISAFMICRTDSGNAEIDKINSNVSWDKIRASFGLPSYGNTITNSSGETPVGDPKNWGSSECSYIHSFMVYDQVQKILVPIADYFVSAWNPVSQNKRDGGINGRPYLTLADMLGSLFAQLYVVDITAEDNVGLPTNFVSLQQFSEFWNKDIIVEADTSNLKEQTSIRTLVTIQKQPMETYLKCLMKNSQKDYGADGINQHNINLVLQGIQRVFSFKYEVPYTLGNLVYLNNQKAKSKNKIMLSVLTKEGQPQIKLFSGDVAYNTLYSWTGKNITPFGQGSALNYAKSFTIKDNSVYMTEHHTVIKNNSFATLSRVLQYDGGEISWNNLAQFPSWGSTYDIQYRGTGDDPHLRKLPLISFFNEYKPGS